MEISEKRAFVNQCFNGRHSVRNEVAEQNLCAALEIPHQVRDDKKWIPLDLLHKSAEWQGMAGGYFS